MLLPVALDSGNALAQGDKLAQGLRGNKSTYDRVLACDLDLRQARLGSISQLCCGVAKLLRCPYARNLQCRELAHKSVCLNAEESFAARSQERAGSSATREWINDNATWDNRHGLGGPL
jgi:hypothetical protein